VSVAILATGDSKGTSSEEKKVKTLERKESKELQDVKEVMAVSAAGPNENKL